MYISYGVKYKSLLINQWYQKLNFVSSRDGCRIHFGHLFYVYVLDKWNECLIFGYEVFVI